MQYPRIVTTITTHKKIARLAKKNNMTIKKFGNQVVVAGLKALGY